MIRTLALTTALTLGTAVAAVADCAIENTVPLKSLSAGFEAWKAVTEAMAECGNVQAELDQEFREKQPAAFAANPSLYQIGGVANETLIPLLNDGTIRPLDDLIAQYGQDLSPNQLIQVDGQTMAVAMMVNAQHMMYRNDIFEELGLDVPETWDDVLAAAEAIQKAGVVDYPLGATMQSGWNLAQDFVNMYLGFGGDFFDENLQPQINSEAGVQTLEMMAALTEYMDPEYLVSDSTYVQQQFQQGKIAMANLWATRAAAMDDEAESQVVGNVKMAAAPASVEGGAPATTLWWDGIVIAKNISDEEAEVAFQVAMEGIDADMMADNAGAAIWLIPGYEPGPLSEGAAQSAAGGAPGYPSSAQMAMLHTALGNGLPAFFTGSQDASATLAAIEEAYLTAAKEAGLIE